MTTLDALADRTSSRRHRECAVAYSLRVLDPPHAAALRRALDNDAVMHTEIADALGELGLDVNQLSVARHRRGDCKCERTA